MNEFFFLFKGMKRMRLRKAHFMIFLKMKNINDFQLHAKIFKFNNSKTN